MERVQAVLRVMWWSPLQVNLRKVFDDSLLSDVLRRVQQQINRWEQIQQNVSVSGGWLSFLLAIASDPSQRIAVLLLIRKQILLTAEQLFWVCVHVLRITFAPTLMVRRILLVTYLQLLLIALRKSAKLFRFLFHKLDARKQRLKQKMATAPSFMEWAKAATELDWVCGNEEWKSDPRSPYYDHQFIQAKTAHFQKLMDEGEVMPLMSALRKGVLRRQGGVVHNELFNHTYIGSKVVVVNYISCVCNALKSIARARPGPDPAKPVPSLEERLTFFQEMRHAFGRSALMLSGGITLGINHLGVIKTLHEHRLLPNIISGSSAGSMVAALVGTVSDEELPQLFSPSYINLNFFKEEDWRTAAWRKMKRLVTQGCLLDVGVLGDTIRGNIGDITFKEAFQKTGRIINISLTPQNKSEYPYVLNYLTAPNVLIWSACLASCAIPLVFESVKLFAKDEDGEIIEYHPEGLKWADGSIEYDLPMSRISELFNVNHFVVSQVNPHVLPFSTHGWRKDFLTRLIHFIKGSIVSYVSTLEETFGVQIPATSLFSQKFHGDITIHPAKVTFQFFRELLTNPTRSRVAAAICQGERRTWPKMSLIHNHLDIEMTLNRCIQQLKDEQARSTGGRQPFNPHADGRVDSFLLY